MDPIKAVENLNEIIGPITQHTSSLRAEMDDVLEQWEGLKNAGGAREDHAAAFLGRLRWTLEALAVHCESCRTQITEMIANPFDRK